MENDIVLAKFERYFIDPDGDAASLSDGDEGAAVENVWHALIILGYLSGPRRSVFTKKLANAVKKFQKDNGGRVDGEVGERTRKLLAKKLLEEGVSIFRRFESTRPGGRPTIFISYSHIDMSWVESLEKWLINHKVNVIRDKRSFIAGSNISRAAFKGIAAADRVIVIWSKDSRLSEWVTEEIGLSKEIERRTNLSVLVYVRLDDTELPKPDTNRLCIEASGREVEEVGPSVIDTLDEDEIWMSY